MSDFDLIVMGGGPGGYAASLRAGQKGLKTCLIEKAELGGVCLNAGCIPSKTLLSGIELLKKTKEASAWGIEVSGLRFHFGTLQARKREVVNRLRKGIEVLCRERKVEVKRGEAAFESPNQIRVGSELINTRYVLIATGSTVKRLPASVMPLKGIWTSREALDSESVPETLLIVGSGAEGCELAQVFQGAGSKVTLLEAEEQILPRMDLDASQLLKRALLKQGVEVLTKTTLIKAKQEGDGFLCQFSDQSNRQFKKILSCVGRSPFFESLNLGKVGVGVVNHAVGVDRFLRTNLSNVYAIGDVVGQTMMAHAATAQGLYVVEKLVGVTKAEWDNTLVPSVVYTNPEVAQVGLSEEECKKRGRSIETSRCFFASLGWSWTKGETEGFVKLVGDQTTGELLGGVVVGRGASELIGTLTLALQAKFTLQGLKKVIMPHPSASEAIQEAAHLFCKEGLHSVEKVTRLAH